MGHEDLAGTLVERREIAKTSSRANGVLHHAPEAFDRIEMVATRGREAMAAQCAAVVVEGRVELVRPMAPAAIDDHHNLFAGFLEGRHHLVEIVAPLLSLKVRHDFRE